MKSVFISSIIAVTLFATANTYAATTNGGVIHFEGELVNAACAVNTESADQVVSLGQYRTDLFNAVELNDCDVSIAATAAVAFSGQADGNNDDLLAIVSGTNVATATGVGIEILDNTSKTLKPDGSVFSEAQSLITGTNVLHFSARYMGTGLSATAGQANADATFIMQYP